MTIPPTPPPSPDELDVVVVGAGLSGVGMACHLVTALPQLSVAVLEAREASGGTWDLFRYPGVRSDSDMFTLSYAQRPWTSPTALAGGEAILDYVRDTAQAYGVDRLVRLGHRVKQASWDSAAARWTLTVERPGTNPATMTCRWLACCTGYYRYDRGHTPDFAGVEEFGGQVVHPQEWPDDLEVAGRRVVVIGSGATAVTLVPALARLGAQVTMLQRSPSYISAVPGTDVLAARLEGRVPTSVAGALLRWRSLLLALALYQLARRRPGPFRSTLLRRASARLPAGFDVDTHLTPAYDPWDQRLCATVDGELFDVLADGRAEMVTDRIERFSRTGIALASGRELAADLVVTATGLELLALGGITLHVDGQPVDVSRRVAYQGMMLSGVPNLSATLGYSNASWTLRADLVARHVSRLLRHLDRRGLTSLTPEAPATLDPEQLGPMMDLQAGYIQRAADRLPRQGPRPPWRLPRNYLHDLALLRLRPLTRGLRATR